VVVSVLLAVLVGCVPAVIETPSYLHGTVLVEDIRHEIWLSRRLFRIRVDNEIRYGAGAPEVLFPAAPREQTDRVDFVPAPDRSSAVSDAWLWLVERQGRAVVAVPAGDSRRREEAEILPGMQDDALILLDRLDDPDRAATTIREAVGETSAGILLLAGPYGPAIAGALFADDESTREHRPQAVVIELFLRRGGKRLREAGVPVDGAITLDLARTLREFRASPHSEARFYVPSVFYRY
jgi:hypothetical protein